MIQKLTNKDSVSSVPLSRHRTFLHVMITRRQSMSGSRLGISSKGRALMSINASFSPRINAAPEFRCMPTSRHYSSPVDRVKTIPWSRHPINSHRSINNGLDNRSTATRNVEGPHRAYIALGSNIGDRIHMIETACNEMTARGIKIKRTSCLWETEPMYVLNQNSFVNGVCEVRRSNHPRTGIGWVVDFPIIPYVKLFPVTKSDSFHSDRHFSRAASTLR